MWVRGRETQLFLFLTVGNDIQLGTEKEIRVEETLQGVCAHINLKLERSTSKC